jgi:chromatin structure-remodeling complex subunit RSC4
VFLDEIKKKLDSSAYETFESVKEDLEVYMLSPFGALFTHALSHRCFQNAKRYNQKESQIWKDAKHLLVSSFGIQIFIRSFCSEVML